MPFDLAQAIQDFRGKHLKEGQTTEITKDVVADIVSMEVGAVKEGISLTEDFRALKDSLFDRVRVPPVALPHMSREATIDQARDTLNRAERQLAAEQAIASFLVNENASLEQKQEESDKTIQASQEVIDGVVTKLQTFEKASSKAISAYNEVFDGLIAKQTELAASISTDDKTLGAYNETIDSLVQKMDGFKSSATDLVAKIQNEAKSVILSLENDLDKAVKSGEVITENFFAMKFVAEDLAQALRTLTEGDRRKNMLMSRTVEARRPTTRRESRDIVDRTRMS